MLRWNLGLTTRLAYALSTVLILFLSSAFISLAHAGQFVGDDQTPDEMPEGLVGSDSEPKIDYEWGRMQAEWARMRAVQDKYTERWQWRKSKYRLYEELADWWRDHGYQGDYGTGGMPGTSGSPYFSPWFYGPLSLPSFVDLIIDVF
jgi:hypothetical protein